MTEFTIRTFQGIPLEDGKVAVDDAGAITHHHQGIPMTAEGRVAVTIDGTVSYLGAGGAGFDAAGRMVISAEGAVANRALNGVGYLIDYPEATDWEQIGGGPPPSPPQPEPTATFVTGTTPFATRDVEIIEFLNGEFVALSDLCEISTSADGLTWSTPVAGPSGSRPYAVAYNGTAYVLTLAGGDLYTSPDLAFWTPRTSGAATTLWGALWNEDLSAWFVASQGGTIHKSVLADGSVWTTEATSLPPIVSLTSRGSTLITGGVSSGQRSVNEGVSWTTSTGTFGGNVFAAANGADGPLLGDLGGNLQESTDDGVSYSLVGANPVSTAIRRVVYDPVSGVYAVCGDTGRVALSNDLVTFNDYTISGTPNLLSCAIGDGIVVLGGDSSGYIFAGVLGS